MRSLFLALSFSALLPTFAPAVESAWVTGWKMASAQAADTKRPILADFTGSDWCGWCKKLKHEVFNTPEFVAWAQRSAVLLEVDFPQGNPLPAEQQHENQRLAEKYAVEGFPTILILSADGTEIGRLGHQAGGPVAWIAAADALLAKTKQLY